MVLPPLFLITVFAPHPSFSSEKSAIGFGRAATGAGECGEMHTCVCHVRSTESLRACLVGDDPALVVFHDRQQELDASNVRVGSNKTIQGPARLTGSGILLILENSTNVIIREITFHSSLQGVKPGSNCARPLRPADVLGCGDMIAINNGSRNIWIDHNEFYDCGNKCITVWAFPRRAKGPVIAPDLITISSNIFRDTYFGILIGLGTDLNAVTGRERVTLYGNLFERVKGRSPRAVVGSWVHFFNNVVMHWGGCYRCTAARGRSPDHSACRGPNYGVGSSSDGNAELLAENNFYEASPGLQSCKEAIKINESVTGVTERGHGSGRVRARGNVLRNNATIQTSEPGQVFDPSNPQQADAHYPYQLLTAEQAKEYAISRAGPEKGERNR